MQGEMLSRLEEILKGIRVHIPDVRLYLLAFYPVNPKVGTNSFMYGVFQFRTNERICAANSGIRLLAKSYDAVYLDLNSGITDSSGNLKMEFTVEGMHMYANGYKAVLDQLIPVLQELI